MSDFVSKVILVCKDGPTLYGQTGLFGWYNFTDFLIGLFMMYGYKIVCILLLGVCVGGIWHDLKKW